MLHWVMSLLFENTCTFSEKWNEDTGSIQKFHPLVLWLMWMKRIRRQGESKIPLCNLSDGKLLRSVSYNNLLDRVAFKILSIIHDGAFPFLEKSSTADVRLDSKCTSDWKSAVNVGVGRLQVHVICSCVLAHSEIVETWSNY